MNPIELSNMAKEQARELCRLNKICTLVSRDDKVLGCMKETTIHNEEGQGSRYHRAINLLVWAPDSSHMIFRIKNEALASAVADHVYYEESHIEAIHRVLNTDTKLENFFDGLDGKSSTEITMDSVRERSNFLFKISPSFASGLEAIAVYSLMLKPGEIFRTKSPMIVKNPRDALSEILSGKSKGTSALCLVLETLTSKYIF